MKRIARVLAAVLVAATALLVLLFALLPREALKEQIGRQIAGWTGREVSLRGEPQIDLFPPLSVTLNDVQVGGPADMEGGEVITIDRLTGTVRLAPLIIGRVEIETFEMLRPVIRLIRDEAGRRNWAFDAGAAALQLAFAGDVPLGVFELQDGTVEYEDRRTGEEERFDSVDLRIEWTSVRTPLALEGSAIWRGEQVAIAADAGAPFAFLNGSSTPIEARVESAPVSMILTGAAEDYPLPQLTGALKLSTSSLRRLAGWLGSPIGSGNTLGQASLFGTAEFRDGVLSVDDAELTLDGNSASGALKITAAAEPEISGTLAFDALDLTPYFAGLAAALSTTADWREVALPTRWLRDMNADVRLSAETVQLGSLRAAGTAASVSLRDARLEIGLARAELSGGSLAGDLAVTHGDSPLIEAQLRARQVDLAATGPAMGLPREMSGIGSAMVDISTSGRDLGGLVDGLSGTARVDLREGRVPSFGIAQLAAEADLAPDPGPENLLPVPVDTASAGFTFSRGVAVLERAKMTTPSYSATAQGWIGLHDGSLGVNGSIETSPPQASADAARSFTIDGTLANPEPLALTN